MNTIPPKVRSIAGKKAELLREIIEQERIIVSAKRAIKRLRGHITTLDNASALIDEEFDPGQVEPGRRRITRVFERGELCGAIFGVLRQSAAPLTTKQVVQAVALATKKDPGQMAGGVKTALRDQHRMGRVVKGRGQDGRGTWAALPVGERSPQKAAPQEAAPVVRLVRPAGPR